MLVTSRPRPVKATPAAYLYIGIQEGPAHTDTPGPLPFVEAPLR